MKPVNKKKWQYVPSLNVRKHIAKWEAEDFAGQNTKFGGDAVGAKSLEFLKLLGEEIGTRLTSKELDGLLSTYYNLSPDSFKKYILPTVKEYALDPTVLNSNKLYDTMTNRYKIAPKQYQKGIRRRAAADTALMGISRVEPMMIESTGDGNKILKIDPSIYLQLLFESTWLPEQPVKTIYPLNNTTPESISSWSGADAPNATPRLKDFLEARQEDLNRGIDVYGDPVSPFSLRLRLPSLTNLLQLNSPLKLAEQYFADALGISNIMPEIPSLFPRFADGKSPIHIKEKNKGKFTALKKRTGHSASWFKAHGTPALKKMATFELNARKWRH